MANLKTMYKGVVNSPDTYLKETLAQGATVMYVMDGSVFGTLPTLAVIGEDQTAETVLVKSKRSDGGFDIQRGFEGIDKKWEKTAAIARNFTNYDYQTLVDNLNTLNNDKVEKSGNKVLSDNNYSNMDKAKVKAIPTNPKYTDTTYDLTPYAKKTEIKTKLSEMVGDSNNRTVTDDEKREWDRKPTLDVMNQVISRAIENKVDKVDGKALSTNDYTNTDKNKVSHLTSSDANHEATTSNRGYMSANDKIKLNDCMRCKVLSQVQYDALSSTDKNRADTLYFIKK